MRELRRYGNIIFSCIITVIASVAVYVLFAGADSLNTKLIQRRAADLQYGWYFFDSNGYKVPVKSLPQTIPANGRDADLHIDTASLPPIVPGDEFDHYICFFSHHQDITILLDGRPIYSVKTRPFPRWITSYRGMYHLVPLPPDYFLAHTITIHTHALTRNAIGKFEPVQISYKAHLLQTILKNRYRQGLLGLCLIVAAVFLLSTSHVFRAFVRKDYSMLFLTILALCTGLWQLEDSRVLQFFTGYQPLHWVLEYLLPLVMPVFTYLFLRHIDRTANNNGLRVLGSLTVIIPLLQLSLQVSGTAALSDTMFLTHGLFIYDSVYTLTMLQKQRRTPMNITLLISFCFSLIIFLFIFISLYFFGIFLDGLMSLGILVTYAAMVLMTYHRVLQKAQETSRNEAKSELYKKLAFTDIATDVQNKTAWYTLIDNFVPNEDAPVEFALVLFDMNNLKKTNDTYGHLVGDEMIKAFAEAVKAAFGTKGTVYRIGGDEFIGLCRNLDRKSVDSILHDFDLAVQNQPPCDHPFSAAWGISYFTPKSRTDFEKAITDADSRMYERKVSMKAARTD
ncbi:MAG: GGDEF domain-containing protein [Treponema sp.]|nr:GGDEF domain-containing protein [Treponema sp.]